jgi:hypothetical protein
LLADVFFGDKEPWPGASLTLFILAGGAFVTLAFANVQYRTLLFSDSYVADGPFRPAQTIRLHEHGGALFYSRTYLQRRGMMRGEY